MHAYECGDLVINFNSDFSGTIRIFQRSTRAEMLVEANELLTLIAWLAARDQISAIEDKCARPWELLGMKRWPGGKVER